MESDTGGILLDEGSEEADGLLAGETGTATVGPGLIGQALWLDGQSYALVPDGGDWDGTTPLTVTAWFRNEGNLAKSVFVGRQDGNANRLGWRFGFNQGRRLSFLARSAGNAGNNVHVEDEFQFLHHDRWHHVAAVVSPSGSPGTRFTAGDVRLYVDGVRVTSPQVVSDNLQGPPTTLFPMSIGASPLSHLTGEQDGWDLEASTTAYPFKGQLDDVRIYAVALSDAQVRALATPTHDDVACTSCSLECADRDGCSCSGWCPDGLQFATGFEEHGPWIVDTVEGATLPLQGLRVPGHRGSGFRPLEERWSEGLGACTSTVPAACEVHAGWQAGDFSASDPFTLAFRTFGNANQIGGTVLSRRFDDATGRGWSVAYRRNQSHAQVHVYIVEDAAATPPVMLHVHTTGSASRIPWRHWAVTYDGSGDAQGITIYYEGSPIASTVVSNVEVEDITTAAPLLIGGDAAGSDLFVGSLDDVAIFGVALGGAEIAALAALPANLCSGDESSCVYPAGGCDGNVLNGCEVDLSSSSSHCGACGIVCAVGWCEAGTCVVPPEICDSTEDEDGDGLVDCDDPDCEDYFACEPVPCTDETFCGPAQFCDVFAERCRFVGTQPGAVCIDATHCMAGMRCDRSDALDAGECVQDCLTSFDCGAGFWCDPSVRVCEPAASCSIDRDCPLGHVCRGTPGACTAPTPCDATTDCGEGRTCDEVFEQCVASVEACGADVDANGNGLPGCLDAACDGTEECTPGNGDVGDACAEDNECSATWGRPWCLRGDHDPGADGQCAHTCALAGDECESPATCVDVGLPGGDGICLVTCNADEDCDAEKRCVASGWRNVSFGLCTTDCRHAGCEGTQTCDVTSGECLASPEHCTNGVDDDLDGMIDCADDDCVQLAAVCGSDGGDAGDPCLRDANCEPGLVCATERETGIPGGMCVEPCVTTSCGDVGRNCVVLAPSLQGCLGACSDDEDCPGSTCYDGTCAPPQCTETRACGADAFCDVTTGRCEVAEDIRDTALWAEFEILSTHVAYAAAVADTLPHFVSHEMSVSHASAWPAIRENAVDAVAALQTATMAGWFVAQQGDLWKARSLLHWPLEAGRGAAWAAIGDATAYLVEHSSYARPGPNQWESWLVTRPIVHVSSLDMGEHVAGSGAPSDLASEPWAGAGRHVEARLVFHDEVVVEDPIVIESPWESRGRLPIGHAMYDAETFSQRSGTWVLRNAWVSDRAHVRITGGSMGYPEMVPMSTVGITPIDRTDLSGCCGMTLPSSCFGMGRHVFGPNLFESLLVFERNLPIGGGGPLVPSRPGGPIGPTPPWSGLGVAPVIRSAVHASLVQDAADAWSSALLSALASLSLPSEEISFLSSRGSAVPTGGAGPGLLSCDGLCIPFVNGVCGVMGPNVSDGFPSSDCSGVGPARPGACDPTFCDDFGDPMTFPVPRGVARDLATPVLNELANPWCLFVGGTLGERPSVCEGRRITEDLISSALRRIALDCSEALGDCELFDLEMCIAGSSTGVTTCIECDYLGNCSMTREVVGESGASSNTEVIHGLMTATQATVLTTRHCSGDRTGCSSAQCSREAYASAYDSLCSTSYSVCGSTYTSIAPLAGGTLGYCDQVAPDDPADPTDPADPEAPPTREVPVPIAPSAEPPRTGVAHVGDPVAAIDGRQVATVTDMVVNGAEPWDLGMARAYHEGARSPGVLGVGWTHAIDERFTHVGGIGAGRQPPRTIRDQRGYGSVPDWCFGALPLVRCIVHESPHDGPRVYLQSAFDSSLYFAADGRGGAIRRVGSRPLSQSERETLAAREFWQSAEASEAVPPIFWMRVEWEHRDSVGVVTRFDEEGAILWKQHPLGSRLIYTWNEGPDGRRLSRVAVAHGCGSLGSVDDSLDEMTPADPSTGCSDLGRHVSFTYNALGLLAHMADDQGQQVEYVFDVGALHAAEIEDVSTCRSPTSLPGTSRFANLAERFRRSQGSVCLVPGPFFDGPGFEVTVTTGHAVAATEAPLTRLRRFAVLREARSGANPRDPERSSRHRHLYARGGAAAVRGAMESGMWHSGSEGTELSAGCGTASGAGHPRGTDIYVVHDTWSRLMSLHTAVAPSDVDALGVGNVAPCSGVWAGVNDVLGSSPPLRTAPMPDDWLCVSDGIWATQLWNQREIAAPGAGHPVVHMLFGLVGRVVSQWYGTLTPDDDFVRPTTLPRIDIDRTVYSAVPEGPRALIDALGVGSIGAAVAPPSPDSSSIAWHEHVPRTLNLERIIGSEIPSCAAEDDGNEPRISPMWLRSYIRRCEQIIAEPAFCNAGGIGDMLAAVYVEQRDDGLRRENEPCQIVRSTDTYGAETWTAVNRYGRATFEVTRAAEGVDIHESVDVYYREADGEAVTSVSLRRTLLGGTTATPWDGVRHDQLIPGVDSTSFAQASAFLDVIQPPHAVATRMAPWSPSSGVEERLAWFEYHPLSAQPVRVTTSDGHIAVHVPYLLELNQADLLQHALRPWGVRDDLVFDDAVSRLGLAAMNAGNRAVPRRNGHAQYHDLPVLAAEAGAVTDVAPNHPSLVSIWMESLFSTTASPTRTARWSQAEWTTSGVLLRATTDTGAVVSYSGHGTRIPYEPTRVSMVVPDADRSSLPIAVDLSTPAASGEADAGSTVIASEVRMLDRAGRPLLILDDDSMTRMKYDQHGRLLERVQRSLQAPGAVRTSYTYTNTDGPRWIHHRVVGTDAENIERVDRVAYTVDGLGTAVCSTTVEGDCGGSWGGLHQGSSQQQLATAILRAQWLNEPSASVEPMVRGNAHRHMTFVQRNPAGDTVSTQSSEAEHAYLEYGANGAVRFVELATYGNPGPFRARGFRHDAWGNLRASWEGRDDVASDPNNVHTPRVLERDFDVYGRLVRESTQHGPETHVLRDAHGRVVRVETRPHGGQRVLAFTEFTLDAAGHPVSERRVWAEDASEDVDDAFYETETSIVARDARGRPVQVATTGSPTLCYLWGPDDTLAATWSETGEIHARRVTLQRGVATEASVSETWDALPCGSAVVPTSLLARTATSGRRSARGLQRWLQPGDEAWALVGESEVSMDGRTVSELANQSQQRWYRYDAWGDLSEIDEWRFGGVETVHRSVAYDGRGFVLRTTDGMGQVEDTLRNGDGSVFGHAVTRGDWVQRTVQTFGWSGAISSATETSSRPGTTPTARSHLYRYDSAGRLTAVETSTGEATHITAWDDLGIPSRIVRVQSGVPTLGVEQVLAHDGAGRLRQINGRVFHLSGSYEDDRAAWSHERTYTELGQLMRDHVSATVGSSQQPREWIRDLERDEFGRLASTSWSADGAATSPGASLVFERAGSQVVRETLRLGGVSSAPWVSHHTMWDHAGAPFARAVTLGNDAIGEPAFEHALLRGYTGKTILEHSRWSGPTGAEWASGYAYDELGLLAGVSRMQPLALPTVRYLTQLGARRIDQGNARGTWWPGVRPDVLTEFLVRSPEGTLTQVVGPQHESLWSAGQEDPASALLTSVNGTPMVWSAFGELEEMPDRSMDWDGLSFLRTAQRFDGAQLVRSSRRAAGVDGLAAWHAYQESSTTTPDDQVLSVQVDGNTALEVGASGWSRHTWTLPNVASARAVHLRCDDDCDTAPAWVAAASLVSQTSVDRTLALVRDLGERVVGLVSETGDVVERYEYDVFGEVIVASLGVVDCTPESNPFCLPRFGNVELWKGGRLDVVLGGYDMRYRTYAPSLRAFMSRDPLSTWASVDEWLYAGGDPVNYWDPWGLYPDPNNTAGSIWDDAAEEMSRDPVRSLWDLHAGAQDAIIDSPWLTAILLEDLNRFALGWALEAEVAPGRFRAFAGDSLARRIRLWNPSNRADVDSASYRYGYRGGQVVVNIPGVIGLGRIAASGLRGLVLSGRGLVARISSRGTRGTPGAGATAAGGGSGSSPPRGGTGVAGSSGDGGGAATPPAGTPSGGAVVQVPGRPPGGASAGNAGGVANERMASSAVIGAAEGASSPPTVTIGRNPNQVYHAFRHVDEMGLSRTEVRAAIEQRLITIANQVPADRPMNDIIEVAGQRIQYTAFRLPDGTINVGRIHAAP